ncbi:hypothetical protein HMPREF3206_00564 [Fusobacterium equinum]|uniref:Uncharacterized protein n=2 Tax=Fusobacterium equinum TaxID=134605 RepID=A0A133NHI6_9FUSO|nr:hypothetical protein HMPREF3206_00564 [Fusobacterium equinum]
MNKIKTKGRKFMNYIQSEDKKEVYILLEEKSKIWEERDFLETLKGIFRPKENNENQYKDELSEN